MPKAALPVFACLTFHEIASPGIALFGNSWNSVPEIALLGFPGIALPGIALAEIAGNCFCWN